MVSEASLHAVLRSKYSVTRNPNPAAYPSANHFTDRTILRVYFVLIVWTQYKYYTTKIVVSFALWRLF